MAQHHSTGLRKHIFDLFHNKDQSVESIVLETGLTNNGVRDILRLRTQASVNAVSAMIEDGELDADVAQDILSANVKLAKEKQRLQDSNRIERKGFREFARADNMLTELTGRMNDLLAEHAFGIVTQEHKVADHGKPMGVIQFSDCHFNEIVQGLEDNAFDFTIASRRIQKHVTKAMAHFDGLGVTQVLVAFTGDLLNSDRRVSEITEAATNRTKAVFLAVEIMQQAIQHLNQRFNVTVASICGNESRVGEYIDWTDFLASDSYDLMIHRMLEQLFIDKPGVTFLKIVSPLESVVDVNGNNFCLVHGHGHSGLARTNKLEGEVTKLIAKYGSRGVRIDYVLCGHIHSAYLGDKFSRSSGLPGNNHFSEKALNLNGRSSQNYYIVYPNQGEIDAVKNDLQNIDGYPGYEFDGALEAYSQPKGSGTVVIQSVMV